MTELTNDQVTANMSIWNEARGIPEKYQETFFIGDRPLTSIDPMFLFRLATEQWGPIGTGWGFDIVKEDVVNTNDTKRHQDALHTMTIKLWYRTGPLQAPVIDGRAVVGLQDENLHHTYGVGATEMYETIEGGDSSYSYRIDRYYNKKTLTAAITNALSRLGFGADVRLGEFEGSSDVSTMVPKEAAIAAAWLEFMKSWRVKHPDREDVTDNEIMVKAIKILQDNSRRVTPETIRSLMA